MKITLLIHGHKPLGTKNEEIKQWYESIYAPLFFMIRERPELKLAVYNNYVLWKWLIDNGSDFTVLLAELLADKRVEILGGAAYEPLLPLLSEEDSIAHLGELSRLIEGVFDVTPRGVWLEHTLWEPSMTTLMSKADVDYVVLNGKAAKGNDFGPLIAVDRGNVLRIFPTHSVHNDEQKDLSRFLNNSSSSGLTQDKTVTVEIDVSEAYKLLSSQDSIGSSEIFSSALDNICQVLRQKTMEATLFSEVCDNKASSGRFVQDLSQITPVREKIAKRPGVLSIYRKMIQVGRKIEFSGRSTRQIRESVLMGQSATGLFNEKLAATSSFRDPLWFNLINAEDEVDSRLHGKGSWVDVEEVDYDGDGNNELLVGSRQLNAYFSPHRGGSLFEIDFKESRSNLLDVIASDLSIFSGAFIDLFPNTDDIASLDSLIKSSVDSQWNLNSVYESRIISDRDTRIELGHTGEILQGKGDKQSKCKVALEKTFRFVADQPSFKVRYRLINHSDINLDVPFAVCFGVKAPDGNLGDFVLINERPCENLCNGPAPEMVQSFTVIDKQCGYRFRVQFTMCSELLIVPPGDPSVGASGIGFVPQWSGPLPSGEILELDFTVDFEKFGGL